MATRKRQHERYQRKPDSNERAAKLVQGVTGEPAPDGDSLLGSPELQREYAEAKKRLRATRSKPPGK